MSMLELFFVVSLVLPPTVVVLGALLLLMPGRGTAAQASATHAHAH
jgi:ABC-type molybdate transport system permease subunit